MSLSDLVFWGAILTACVAFWVSSSPSWSAEPDLGGFGRASPWKTAPVREIMIVSAFVGLAGVLVWIGLLLWAAREDGRDQQRREYLRGR